MYKSGSSSSQATDGSKEELQRLRKIIEDQRVALVQQNKATVQEDQISSTTAASIEGKLDQIASSVKGFNEDLATFKERQINPVDNQTLKDVARMTYQQREELKVLRKQLREWTMYSSARECYD
ncbi:hypothetical protein PIB30_115216, partial [Stylosanthes scabra]|nr:hypothetical protein [Stylosanthes scabra]